MLYITFMYLLIILFVEEIVGESTQIKEKKIISLVNLKIIKLTSITLFLLFLLLIKWTDDWKGYEKIFYNNGKGFEYSFYLVTKLVKYLNGSYECVYYIYIFGIVFFMNKFLKKFKINVSYFLFLIFISMVFYISNQIRYFLAFFLFLNAVYYIYFNHKKLGILYYIFSIFFHYSILLLFPVIILIKCKKEKLMKKIKWICFIIFLICQKIMIIDKIKFISKIPHLKRVVEYIYRQRPTLIGVIFMLIFPIIFMGLIYILDKKIKINDENYEFLYKISIIPIIYIPLGLISIHFTYRYIIPFIITQIICLYYQIKKNRKAKYLHLIFLISLVFLYFYTFHILPPILGKNSQIESIIKVYKSSGFVIK